MASRETHLSGAGGERLAARAQRPRRPAKLSLQKAFCGTQKIASGRRVISVNLRRLIIDLRRTVSD